MFKTEQQFIEQQIHHFFVQEGIPEIPIAWKWIPFSGHWGISTSFFQSAALEARQGKKVVVAQRAQEIAEQVVRFLGNPQGFSRLEAVNGYLNLYFSTGEYAQRVVDTVLQEKDQFGKGDDKKTKSDGRILTAQHTQSLPCGALAQCDPGRCGLPPVGIFGQ